MLSLTEAKGRILRPCRTFVKIERLIAMPALAALVFGLQLLSWPTS